MLSHVLSKKSMIATVNDTLNACLAHHAPIAYKKEHRRLGFISFLHTFGRDMKWHPHIHVLIAERYLNNLGQFKKYDYFSFDFLRITFQNKLFHNIYMFYKNVIKDFKQTKDIYKLLKSINVKYSDGFYVYGRKFDHSCSTTRDVKSLTNYIASYASHPPISERRIVKLDIANKLVTWFYDPHEDDDIQDEDKKLGRQFITEDVFSFMERLIIHIPDIGFQLIRYYGFYANKFK